MTMDQWKAKKVQQCLAAINYNLPKDVAEQWVAEQGYNVTLSLERYNKIYG